MDLEPLYRKIEAAIAAHPELRPAPYPHCEPMIEFSRLGVTVKVDAKVRGLRKLRTFHATEETAEGAVQGLIDSLDSWVAAFRS